MADSRLRFLIRTPRAVIASVDVVSARVVTETGHVGLRPRMEALVLAVDPGLVLLHTGDGLQFAGSAGGLLSCDGVTATLFTPLAVVGADAAGVRAELDRALAEPNAEREVRLALDRLQGRILTEVRRQAPGVVMGDRS